MVIRVAKPHVLYNDNYNEYIRNKQHDNTSPNINNHKDTKQSNNNNNTKLNQQQDEKNNRDEKMVHEEYEEKPVVESTARTSEDVHGGDEITYSINKPNEDGQKQQNMSNNEQYPTNFNFDQQQGNNINNGFTQQSENDQQSEMNGDTQQNQNDDIQPSNNVSQQQATEQQPSNQQCQPSTSNSVSQQQTTSNNDDMQQDNNTSQYNEDNTQNEETSNNESTEQQTSNGQQNNEDETTQQSNTDANQQDEDGLQTNDNDQNDTEQQEDDNQLDDSTSDEPEDYNNNDGHEDQNDNEEGDEQQDTSQYNTQQAFEISNNVTKRQLYLTFYRLVEYLSDEEKQPTMLPGQSLVLNVKRLMMRQYERKPINAYYYYRTRSQVILMLDNSGSMEWLLDELDAFFAAALKRKDVQIYIAPNGNIESYYDDKTKRFESINHKEAIQQIIRSGLPVVYIGDFDGANTPIELSWTNRVYWICPETRYKYFSHHNWVGYYEDDFKGFFGRTFNAKEMIEVLQQFTKNIYKQRFWYDKHNVTDFKEEE